MSESSGSGGLLGLARTSIYLLGIFVLLMIVLSVYYSFSSGPSTKTVVIDGASHQVLVANNPVTRYLGLSRKTVSKLGAEGMMFTFLTSQERTFEMRGMLFDLDFIWVNDGKVVKVNQNVPAPEGDEKPVLVSSEPTVVDTVFEFPAGFVRNNDINPGDTITVR